MTGATSVERPATETTGWPGPGWLRIAVLAGLAGGLAAAAWNGLLGEPVLGQAIKLEDAVTAQVHTVAMTEPFTRREQQGGMVLGELLLGCGLGLLIAGAALVAGPGFLGPVRRAWLALVAVGAWSFLVLPAIAFPAMPPGVESSLSLDTRQVSYTVLVCSGALGAVLARMAWLRLGGRTRPLVAAVAFTLPAVLAVVLLPHEHVATPIDHALLTRFRLVAVGSQAVFWGLMAIAGGGCSTTALRTPCAPRGRDSLVRLAPCARSSSRRAAARRCSSSRTCPLPSPARASCSSTCPSRASTSGTSTSGAAGTRTASSRRASPGSRGWGASLLWVRASAGPRSATASPGTTRRAATPSRPSSRLRERCRFRTASATRLRAPRSFRG